MVEVQSDQITMKVHSRIVKISQYNYGMFFIVEKFAGLQWTCKYVKFVVMGEWDLLDLFCRAHKPARHTYIKEKH